MNIINDRPYFLQMAIFFVLCASLCVGVWLGLRKLNEYREEYDMIVDERDNFAAIMETLRAKNATLHEINKFNFNDMSNAPDSVEFYAQVRKLIEENSMNMLSMSTNEDNVLTLKLQGNYYSLVHLFADWREMPYASRITSLSIVRDNTAPEDFVEADLTLEAWMAK